MNSPLRTGDLSLNFYAAEVRVIEHMVRHGLLTVGFRQVEGQTGRRSVDMGDVHAVLSTSAAASAI